MGTDAKTVTIGLISRRDRPRRPLDWWPTIELRGGWVPWPRLCVAMRPTGSNMPAQSRGHGTHGEHPEGEPMSNIQIVSSAIVLAILSLGSLASAADDKVSVSGSSTQYPVAVENKIGDKDVKLV